MERTRSTAQRLPHPLCGKRSKYFSRASSSPATLAASTCYECFFLTAICSEHITRFIFATESYGGHYGPSFVTYFEEQNTLIASGAIEGEPIVVSALMINK